MDDAILAALLVVLGAIGFVLVEALIGLASDRRAYRDWRSRVGRFDAKTAVAAARSCHGTYVRDGASVTRRAVGPKPRPVHPAVSITGKR
jgi:hypothetical protein